MRRCFANGSAAVCCAGRSAGAQRSAGGLRRYFRPSGPGPDYVTKLHASLIGCKVSINVVCDLLSRNLTIQEIRCSR